MNVYVINSGGKFDYFKIKLLISNLDCLCITYELNLSKLVRKSDTTVDWNWSVHLVESFQNFSELQNSITLSSDHYGFSFISNNKDHLY